MTGAWAFMNQRNNSTTVQLCLGQFPLVCRSSNPSKYHNDFLCASVGLLLIKWVHVVPVHVP
jgi:hypothetical protein